MGDCVAAGSFAASGVPPEWNGDSASLPPVPPLQDSIAAGVPPLTALPDVDNQFFCIDEKSGQERFCSQAELKICHRGAKGEMPDAKKCVCVGVLWPSVCPPGFVVDEKNPVAAGLLPTCLPDPADCGKGPWPDVGTSNGVIYVSVDTGSDTAPGTADKPLKSIGKALLVASSGTTVAVAAGTYDETTLVTKSVNIWGAARRWCT